MSFLRLASLFLVCALTKHVSADCASAVQKCKDAFTDATCTGVAGFTSCLKPLSTCSASAKSTYDQMKRVQSDVCNPACAKAVMKCRQTFSTGTGYSCENVHKMMSCYAKYTNCSHSAKEDIQQFNYMAGLMCGLDCEEKTMECINKYRLPNYTCADANKYVACLTPYQNCSNNMSAIVLKMVVPMSEKLCKAECDTNASKCTTEFAKVNATCSNMKIYRNCLIPYKSCDPNISKLHNDLKKYEDSLCGSGPCLLKANECTKTFKKSGSQSCQSVTNYASCIRKYVTCDKSLPGVLKSLEGWQKLACGTA